MCENLKKEKSMASKRAQDPKTGKFVKKGAPAADPTEAVDTPEWVTHPWTPELIRSWSSNPDFRAYCKEQGFPLQEEVSDLKTTQTLEGNIDISNIAEVIAEAILRVQKQTQLPTVQPQERGTELITFPEPLKKQAITPQGQKMEVLMPLYPINIAGEDYSGSGYYDPKVLDRLKEEIDGSRWVEIPYNTAFVEYTFQRTNEKGKIEKVKEMFTGPGVFAGKILAESLLKQLGELVEHTMAGGPDAPLIPGTKTQYNDVSTNGVLFVPGFTYKVPKHVAEDLARRVREHAASFQRVHQERISLGKQGLSIYSGVQLAADEAQARKDAGMNPDQIDKVVREGRI